MPSDRIEGNDNTIIPHLDIPGGPFSLHWYFFKRYKWNYGATCILSAASAACGLTIPFFIAGFINLFKTYERFTPAFEQEFWSIFGMFLFIPVFCTFVTGRLSTILPIYSDTQLGKDVRDKFFSRLLDYPYRFFTDRHAGRLGNSISEATLSIGNVLYTISISLVYALACIIFSVIYAFFVSPYLGGIFLAFGVLFTITCLIIASYIYKTSQAYFEARAIISGTFVDVLSNIHSQKLYDLKEKERSHIQNLTQDCLVKARQFMWAVDYMRIAMDVWGQVLLIVLPVVAFYGWQNGIFGASDVGYMLSSAVMVNSYTWSMGADMRDIFQNVGISEKAAKDILSPVENYGLERTLPEKAETPARSDQSFIKFEHVHFDYNGQAQAISDLSLHIGRSEKIGVIGPSGAGKSTLINLLTRFCEGQPQQISIDNQNIYAMDLKALRGLIAVIPQDTALFHRSLMENIRYGRLNATDKDVIEAAKKAHAHEFISELPERYNTLVGERGVKLSGGQRQRIAIARAILKDAPILILDEATSALDSESEKLIQESLHELMEGKTVIAIAHRLSTIAHLDRLIVMDQGKIIEDGSHEELLKQDGLYAKLWNMQSGGFLGE